MTITSSKNVDQYMCGSECIQCTEFKCDTLRDFGSLSTIIDSHVLRCPYCCQNRIMRAVLGEYSNSRTSRQMLEAVISFEMNTKPADPYLVDEFFIRHGFWETLEERDGLTDEQVYRGLIYAWKRWTEINRHSSPMLHKPNETKIRSLAVRLSRIHEAVKNDTCPPENGFMDWLQTAEVLAW